MMFDKMKQLMQMQKTMQEIKRQLDATVFDVSSSDGLVTVTMNGSQEVQGVSLQPDFAGTDKTRLEKAVKDAYNKAVKRSHELAAQKMKGMTGLDIPGLG